MVDYLVSLGTFTTVFTLFSLGLNLQWGYTGLINFGQVAFLGLGAYTTILLGLAGVPLPLCVLAGAILAALLGLLIGVSTLRLREDYLAIVTIGVAEVMQRIALNEEWLTRGARGVYGYPLPLKTFQPTSLVQTAMSAVVVAILVIAAWRLWLWLPTQLKSEQRPTKTAQNLGFLAYLGAIVGVEYSFWYWLRPLLERATSFNWGGLALTIFATLIGIGVIVASQRQPLKAIRSQSWSTYLLLGATTLCLGFLALLGRAEIISLWSYSYKAGLLWLLILFTALSFWQLERWVNSPWGRVLKAIREDEEVPKALGKNVFFYKLQSFMLGGALTGIAGAFYAWQLSFVEPKGTFDSLLTFQAWTIVVLGGAGNNVGTLLGAAIFWAYNTVSRFLLPAMVSGAASFVRDYITQHGLSPDNFLSRHLLPAILSLNDARLGALRVMLIGLLLVVLMMWRPQGMLGKKEELTLGR
jgi:neutral amino acid transport system permease protein